ncbi:MAG TPA: hypothetical protein PKE12_15725 [Kiritimatiellia bacterium]|nr:hypothetical protein [Kiritimatiellia bacterium]
MKQVVVGGLCLAALALPVHAERVVREITWEEGAQQRTVVRWEDGTPAARVLNAETTPRTESLAVMEKPDIQSARYAVVGEVAYQDVDGVAYLEMWNHFANGGAYFSRTLADSGPMGKLSGTSPKRAFLLPFQNEEGAPAPVRLEINVVLPGRGSVDVGPLRLIEYSGRTAGVVSGWRWQRELFVVAVMIPVIVVYLFLRKRTCREELRRMQAIDSGG